MKQQRTLAEWWLWLGVTALALAGMFAVILVVARTPQLAALTVFQQLFSVALVIHVDLSVLMWFLAMLGVGCALLMEKYPAQWMCWPKAAWCTVAAATASMALAPLEPHWEVMKSNYIPVLGGNNLFLLSLGLLAAGLCVLVLPVIATYSCVARRRMLNLIEIGWLGAAMVVALALVAFYLSARALPRGEGQVPYETLFWVGGHVLQFAFSLLMMAAWVALLQAMGAALPSRRGVLFAYGVTLVGALVSLAGFVVHPFNSSAFVQYQTEVMKFGGGLGVVVLGAMVTSTLVATAKTRSTRAYASTLSMSLILFGAGGALGIMISGQNVTIPAHYHGEIVGITLALMGLAYAMLPRFGYASVAATRLAFWQPIVYGVGQLMHIGGLGYSGGYGVLRKTPGAVANSLTPDVKIAMGVMGMGGLLAVIGGLLFVVVMLRVRRVASVPHQVTGL